MRELLVNLWQEFIYGILHRTPNVDLSVIPQSVRLKVGFDKKNDLYWLESPDLPDFEATGKSLEELNDHYADTLLVYFDIPHFHAKRSNLTTSLRLSHSNTNQEIVVSKDSLERVLVGA
jgi:hypothetical protein